MVSFTTHHNESDHCPVKVRPADRSDAPAIAAVHVASWEGAYRGMIPDEALDRRTVARQTEIWQGILDGIIDGSRPWVFVAQLNGLTVGFASMIVGVPTAEITALYVEPSAWRGGAGTALMDAALAEVTRRGCAEVTLWVLEPNLRARAFYQRFGFADDGGRQRNAVGWPVELRMRRGEATGSGHDGGLGDHPPSCCS